MSQEPHGERRQDVDARRERAASGDRARNAEPHVDTDGELIARLQSASAAGGAGGGGPSDKEAWTQLIRRHQQQVYLTCLRYSNNPETALDLTQDVFVKVIQAIDTFDNRSQFTTWMTRIAINVCLSHRRAAKVRRTVSLSEDGGVPGEGRGARGGHVGSASHNRLSNQDFQHTADGSSEKNAARRTTDGETVRGELSAEERVEWEERRARLYSALAELPPDQRALLILRDVQGLEYEQIAEVVSVPLGTLKSRLFRARLALRELMERSGERGEGGTATSE